MQNDPTGAIASADAARAKLAQMDADAVLQQQLPDLRAQREDILRRKAAADAALKAFDTTEEGNYRGALAERDPARQPLVDQQRAVAQELNAVNAAIAAVPPVMSPHDRSAHLEDLRRRAGLGAEP